MQRAWKKNGWKYRFTATSFTIQVSEIILLMRDWIDPFKKTHMAIFAVRWRKLFWPLKSYQKMGQDIGSQIREKSVELKGVFFTHLHIDHASGMQHLPKDIAIVVGKDEPVHSLWPLYYQDNFAGVESLYEINFDATNDLQPLGKCADIFGDGSLWAIHLPFVFHHRQYLAFHRYW